MSIGAEECHHLDDFKANELKTYKLVHAIFVVCTNEDSRQIKLKNALCHVCNRLGPHLHTCLHCVFFGCHRHIREHVRTTKHRFSMDLNYGQVHCASCNDYVYDAELDEIAMENKMAAVKCNKRLMSSSMPSDDDLASVNSKRICINRESTIGLRGLLNLGSTCFINCIVQALMHTPLLREYFLSERHKCKGNLSTCLVCELSRLFQEFYRGQRVPLALNKLLHLIWTEAEHMAGYEQQDAHEFFIVMLNVLHKHCADAMSPPIPPDEINKCPCIIDQIFSGRLQSDLVCQKCNGVSTTIDPIWDLSLDLGPVTLGGRPPSSLIDCLERYTRAEHLGANVKIMCSNCEAYQESTKQLTMKTLPIVVSLHLKRSQHSNEIETKISTLIPFPETLDMTPFMSKNKSSTVEPVPTDNRYSLFAVINHVGTLINAGHYTAYVRQQHDFWYKCDDHVITRANLKEVLDSEAYQLLYHKHILSYD